MQTASASTAPLASIGIDIGKDVFHFVGFDIKGKIAFRRKIKRLALVETFKKIPPSIVGLEACLSAHFVSRALRALGHEPRIIPAMYVKPFVKGQKNDYNDAEAIAERRFARICILSAKKPKISSISKPATGSGRDLCRAGPRPSIRSALS